MYESGDNITRINNQHSIVHTQNSDSDICILGDFPYQIFPTIFTLNSLIDLDKAGIRKVQNNPNLALFGEGVLVGIIDTGIDYRHPAFRRNDGTSKILSIWDQTIQEGIPPEGFNYGTEYKRETINLALESEDPFSIVPSTDEIGHGTAIASIVSGSPDLENSFTGIVPSSELIVVKLKQAKQNIRTIFFVPEDAICYQETDIMLAIRYIVDSAISIKRPLVLCIAFGTSQSGHDSLGATSSYLSRLSQREAFGVAIAAGNEGNNQRHFFGLINVETHTRDFELNIGSQDKMFGFEIWCDTLSRISIEITSPNGEVIPEVFPGFNVCSKFSFVFEASTVWINNNILEEQTGDQMILIRFLNPSEGIWKIRIRNIGDSISSFHAWLPSGDLLSRGTFFLEPNPNTTITSPGNAVNTMTVTAYNQMNDTILLESGRGYTRSNDIKPDFAAPGYQLTCATVNGGYAAMTGTGAATAYASGVIAMILEWGVLRGNYPSITGMDINRLIIRGAVRDKELVYPNTIWGYGKINIEEVFEKLQL